MIGHWWNYLTDLYEEVNNSSNFPWADFILGLLVGAVLFKLVHWLCSSNRHGRQPRLKTDKTVKQNKSKKKK